MAQSHTQRLTVCLIPASLSGCRTAIVQAMGVVALCVFVIFASTSCNSNTAGAQTSASAGAISGPPVFSELWGARLPRVCNKVKSKPNAAVVAALIQCSKEREISGYLELIQDINVELGPTDSSGRGFAIRGSQKFYTCTSVHDFTHNKGINCGYQPQPRATGGCGLNAFSEWECNMGGSGSDTDYVSNIPGPTTY